MPIAALPVLARSTKNILDSCPFLPLFTWSHGFELAPHVVGSWHVPALPGNYGTEEWQIIASLLGIQTAAVGGFMYFLHK